MMAYPNCYWEVNGDDTCNCWRCKNRRQQPGYTPPGVATEPWVDEKTSALIDIAHDCGTLEAAQRRAKEALKP